MYRHMAGINPSEDQPGFRHTVLAPMPDFRIQWTKAHIDTAAGAYRSEWKFDEHGKLYLSFSVPFNATATIKLPRAIIDQVLMNGIALSDAGLPVLQGDHEVCIEVASGNYDFNYMPSTPYKQTLSTRTPLNVLLRNEESRSMLQELSPTLASLDPSTIGPMGEASIRDLSSYPSFNTPEEELDELDLKLMTIQLV
jgi:alpha-L-rhamnosidase